MCGICGFIGTAEPELLPRMREALSHRGPDESGEFRDDIVQFGHRRLSVIDLGAGQQPFASEDGSIVLVFNGEIYNHEDIRRRLEGRGHRYRTRSDTESIVHAYREWGDSCLEQLDGMFAFVIYDKAQRRLFGARDRFGKKPFYYSVPGQHSMRRFVFASEVRSLLRDPSVRAGATLSEDAIIAYLLHDYVPGTQTAFDNIRRLPAGHAFSLGLDEPAASAPVIWAYWQNPILEGPPRDVSEAEAIAEVDRLLDAAVQRRLMSDVPLGVFLSGGIDSSAIVAYLARHRNPSEILTFSIGFDDPSFDESAFAAAAADHYGTSHHWRRFSARDCLAEIDTCIRHLDEPFADPSVLPTAMLSRFARESVTVALGGDGGDELFAGYDPFRAITAARAYSAVVPDWMHRMTTAGSRRFLKSSGRNMSLGFRIERFLRGARAPDAERMTTWLGAFDPEGIAAVTGRDSASAVRQQFFGLERAAYAAIDSPGADPIRAALCYFQSFYLIDDILLKADRASMMSSLELRSPFLDTALAEYVNRLPSRLKFRGRTTKYLLKRILARADGNRQMVPDTLLRRPKKGFGIPVSRWIRGDLKEQFQASLLAEWPASLGFLDSRRIAGLLQGHLRGAGDHGKELWALFMLGGWARHWAG